MRASARVDLYYGKQKRFMGVLFGGKKNVIISVFINPMKADGQGTEL